MVIKIICYLIVYLITQIMKIYINFKNDVKYFFHIIKFFLIFQNKKSYFKKIIKLYKINFPKHISIVLNNYKNFDIKILLDFIDFCELTKEIKILSIYDPFNILKNEKKIFNDKINIFIIDFKEANNNLIKNILKNNKRYPTEFEKIHNNDNNFDYNKEINENKIEKFYTRKNSNNNILPEIIITFNNNNYFEDICLYGYPFTLLENCEIINFEYDFNKIDIIFFLEIFIKNSKIQKRFGV